jgi:hypothetical protein
MFSNRIRTEGIACGSISIHAMGAFCRNVGCSLRRGVEYPLTQPPIGTSDVHVPFGDMDMRVAVRMPAGA